jgi:alkylation response protein AidB-like acyl-CoA dehydrogenase
MVPTVPGGELSSTFSLDAALRADQFRHLVATKELGPLQCRCLMPVVCSAGNGILLENHVGRFVADAIYSYEGTREMNPLIVGKSITGLSAFV